MGKRLYLLDVLLVVFWFGGCTFSQKEEVRLTPFSGLDFAEVPAARSGIHFINKITEGKKLNYFTYPNIYSGGGVAVGDINNDGLADIYFSGNMVKNRLYLNEGNLYFKDITDIAEVDGLEVVRWTRGVTMVDINNDGLLDIYVNVSDPAGRRNNLLYVNQGDLKFTEQAAEYGIDDESNSVQSIFFDYDKDGDPDLYICSYPTFNLYNSNDFFKQANASPQLSESDKLYRNDGEGKFTDVTVQSGILNYGLTLNASITDFNQDGWPDIYVSNDFNAKDFLYINNGDGSFTDRLAEYFPHTSNFGMGTDAADFNNDGLVDLFQCDMMADNNAGKKTNMSAMDPATFYETIASGLHYQYMRNCLQLNNGNATFSDVAEMAGVGYTDWSWSALFADLNNDGWKDLFVSNGMRRGVNNNDYLNFSSRLYLQKKITDRNQHKLVRLMPVNPVDNYVFVNEGALSFSRQQGNGGLSFKGFTHGVAYADFDLDGDLDMVFNNQDARSLIFENKARQAYPEQNYLRVKLYGGEHNRLGLGAKVTVTMPEGSIQTQELILSRGYQSSVEPVLHFGLGRFQQIPKIEVIWSDGSSQQMKAVKVNQELEVKKKSILHDELSTNDRSVTSLIFTNDHVNINYEHEENLYDDFKKESLLPHKMSQFGPALAVADLNTDGLDDLFVGGSKGKKGGIYIQKKDGSFEPFQEELFDKEKIHEDVDALFFDADGDGDSDLYVVSGGNEESEGSVYYNDRFYENREGTFFKNTQAIPKINSSGSCVVAADYDGDGDQDLFIGGRQVPGQYPMPASSLLLENNSSDGQIFFRDKSQQVAPMLRNIGMVTDAKWVDIDNDKKKDLILVGEWMPIRIFKNGIKGFTDISEKAGLLYETGWWNTINYGDFDHDGDLDLIAGNLGLNYKYKASRKHPFNVYAKDFDENQSFDIVLGYYEEETLFPLRGRECSSNQMPFIKKKFPTYEAFAQATLTDVFGEENLNNATHYEAVNFATSYIENLGNGKFEIRPMDRLVQISSVNSIIVEDLNRDGHLDVVMGGNLFGSEVETPRNDAGYGIYMKGDGKGGFEPYFPHQSGLMIKGEIKHINLIKVKNRPSSLVFAVNNNPLQFVSYE
ncbi:VCBS repeat-containing protein [Fulvivirgaceae bacterium BMA10]|uniref:VCBS repeat-containing protein n=1 Tax=Splendidivirga corallicola TaxID=3051826 RepID=A0ABT8KW69_9BACT|nr:VCBS repeat-containing protein [Fulvivirgaceae bacterium BMA10]